MKINEGQFSWFTQDTDKQIGSDGSNVIDVTMYDDKGNAYEEDTYEGYGDFGGKDYYELLAEMNGYTEEDAKEKGVELRDIGININFNKLKPKNGGPVKYPALIEYPRNFNYKTWDFTQRPEADPNQGWLIDDEDDYDVYESKMITSINEYKKYLKKTFKN